MKRYRIVIEFDSDDPNIDDSYLSEIGMDCFVQLETMSDEDGIEYTNANYATDEVAYTENRVLVGGTCEHHMPKESHCESCLEEDFRERARRLMRVS